MTTLTELPMEKTARAGVLLRTPLYDWHVAHGAKIVDFNGWEMPIQYEGILAEHTCVRMSVGIFDIAHMGTVDVLGLGALDFVQKVITNDAARLSDGKALYSPMCLPTGGIVDDVLVYRMESKRYRFVINAGNRQKDLAWLQSHAAGHSMEIRPMSQEISLIAVQGPNATPLLQELLRFHLEGLAYYSFFFLDWDGQPLMVSRTGYTGERGYELFVPTSAATGLWKKLVQQGRRYGIKPIGLGARDTLRMEMGYCLYGHEIDETTTPLEAGLAWTIGFGKKDFIGKEALVAQQKQGLERRLTGLKMLDRSIPRAGCDILQGGEKIGRLTSGGFSPSLQCGIGLGYVPRRLPKEGADLAVRIRDVQHVARTARIPFYDKNIART